MEASGEMGDQLLSSVAQRGEGDKKGRGCGRRVVLASWVKWVMDELVHQICSI